MDSYDFETFPASVAVAEQEFIRCVAMGDESDITGAKTMMVRRNCIILDADRP
jgi:hypothetical protein